MGKFYVARGGGEEDDSKERNNVRVRVMLTFYVSNEYGQGTQLVT